jgi:hypothetical protein
MILLELLCSSKRLILRMVVAIDRYDKIENCDSDAREGVKDASLWSSWEIATGGGHRRPACIKRGGGLRSATWHGVAELLVRLVSVSCLTST